ncbi:MlaD family protein [Arsenicibacter rosenii]|uniref:ABC transporter permease n=1 Tax=Arsenicibacter rosenii TaxID=1750698 RepID=A0A1S2VFL2_9BACT|nr:MlaD family protein [Arsenicibacter rosenii]OIN57489.1 ABC transporter permease [Arsenicibacter rosenii]
MKGDNKRGIIVGIFVALGLLILVAGILILGGQQKRFTSSIRVNAIFDDVGGLKAGNNVWFSGVKIGTVRRVFFYGTSQVEVEMNIEEKSQQYIRKDAKATISSDGLIGNKIVLIIGGTPKVEPVEDGDILKTQAALSSDQIMETLQENNQNLLQVTKDFKEMVGKIKRGKGTVGAVLTDTMLAENFRNTIKNMEAASKSAARVSGSLSQFAAKMNTKGALANELVTDTTVFRSLRASAQKLRQASDNAVGVTNQAAVITRNLEQTTNKLNSPNSPLGVLMQDEETAKNLKNTLQNLNRGSVLLNEDLEAAQHNFLLKGYFKKKEKEKQKEVEKQ